MTIEEARNDLLKTLESMDKDKLSLSELKIYAETLKIASEVQVKTFSDYFASLSSCATGIKQPTVSDLK